MNRFIPFVGRHLTLSLMWLVGCLPLVTAPAATAALFDVARQRARGEEPALGWSFVAAFRQHFWTALAVGLGWAALGAVLAADLAITTAMAGTIGTLLLVALLALLLLYAAGSVALFPVLVSYHARPHQLIRTAGLVVLLFPGRSLLGLAAVAAAAGAVWIMPLTIIIAPSLAALAVQHLYQAAFLRLRARAGESIPQRPAAPPVAAVPAGSH